MGQVLIYSASEALNAESYNTLQLALQKLRYNSKNLHKDYDR